MKGTFSERPKKVKRIVPTLEEATIDSKKAKRKAAKEQARQLNPTGTTPTVQSVSHVGGYGPTAGIQQGIIIFNVNMVLTKSTIFNPIVYSVRVMHF